MNKLLCLFVACFIASTIAKSLIQIDYMDELYNIEDYDDDDDNSTIIYCPFENDYCSWKRYPKTVNKTMYGWSRYNSQQLDEQNIPGPPSDPSEGDEGFYVLASDYISSDVETGTNGRIASPYILGKDYPEVCFSFKVYFGVSIIRIIEDLQILK